MGPCPHALLLGGTGSLWCTAEHLARAGWAVTVTGRDAARVPHSATELGIRFVRSDHDDREATTALVGDGVDLLVEGQGYHPNDAMHLAQLSWRCGSTAYLSAKAVYVDPHGHHLNSPGGVHFSAPVTEDTSTMPWHDQDVHSAEGYGAGKAESERMLLEHGERVSILRPSKIHGPWVRQVRTASVLDLVAREPVPAEVVVHQPEVLESTTSTEVLARTVLACAGAPGQRVLNVADAGPRPAGELAEQVWRAAGIRPTPRAVEGLPGAPGSALLPWRVPMVLDTTALSDLGVALPTFAETAWMEVEWVRSRSGAA